MKILASLALSSVQALTLGLCLKVAHAAETASPAPGPQEAEDTSKWDLTLGAGVGVGPEYEGSDDYGVRPLPVLRLEWNDRFFFDPIRGVGANFKIGNAVRLMGSVGYDPGRDQDDNDHLDGLGDIDPAATLNLGIEHRLGLLSPFATLRKHLGGTDGLQADFGVKAMVPLTGMKGKGRTGDRPKGPALMLGVSAQWADDRYMEDYFGVTSNQSNRSGLAQYDAGSGIKSVGASIGLLYPFAERWALNTRVGYKKLVGDAADSPIVKDENQFSGGMFLSYKF